MIINFPRWFWWVLALVLIIVICVVLKINANVQVGSNGIGGSITQGLVR